MATDFAISYSPRLRWLFVPLGLGPRHSGVRVDDERVVVRLGVGFRAELAKSAVRRAERYDGRVLAWGAHGWRHRWLVNGSSHGVVVLTLDPWQRGRTLGFPLRLAQLAVSVEDPEGLIAAVAPG